MPELRDTIRLREGETMNAVIVLTAIALIFVFAMDDAKRWADNEVRKMQEEKRKC